MTIVRVIINCCNLLTSYIIQKIVIVKNISMLRSVVEGRYQRDIALKMLMKICHCRSWRMTIYVENLCRFCTVDEHGVVNVPILHSRSQWKVALILHSRFQ